MRGPPNPSHCLVHSHRIGTATQKLQLDQLEHQIEALLKRLYGSSLPAEDAPVSKDRKRASIQVPAELDPNVAARSRSKSDHGVVKEVAKKTSSLIRRLSDALPSTPRGSSRSSPRATPSTSNPPSTTPTPRGSGIQGGPLGRSRSGPATTEETAVKHEPVEPKPAPVLPEKAKERVVIPASTESPRRRKMGGGSHTLRGVPGESSHNASLRRLRSMHVSTPMGPVFEAASVIRRTRSEEQLASWDCMETTLIGRKTSSRSILVHPERPRVPSLLVSALEQEYRTSGSASVKKGALTRA